MKNNIFGYIFIVFIICIMGFAIYKVKIQNVKKNENTKNNSSEGTSQLVKGKEIKLAISEFDTMNPIITKNKKVQDISRIIYEPLINITYDFRKQYILAEECAKISANTYIVKIKQGIKWSDGAKFTSNDVKYTIDRLKENEDTVYSQNIKSIQEVDIIDNYTIRIILSKEINNFEYYLNFPILSSSYYAGTDFWNTEKNNEPTSTGQFKIAEVNQNSIILEKNEKWWNDEEESILEKITINLYSSVAELYNAFKMGGIDFIATENSSFQEYIGTIGYNITEIEGREYIFVALNTTSGILSDINVRKAIRAGIDKNRVISNSYGNMYKSSNFPINTSNYLIEEKDENFYNQDEFGNFLSSAGWKFKGGIWQKQINNKIAALELNMVVRASDNSRCKAAEDIKIQLADKGIRVNIVYSSDDEYNMYLNNINYDMMLCSITQPIAPDLTTYFGSNNLANYYPQEVNEIMSYIENGTDEKELKNKFQRLYEIYNEDVPYIGIARNKILAINNTNLVGEIKANWYNLFSNISNWYTV